MIRNCIFIAQRKSWASEPTSAPVDWILCFLFWYHVINTPFNSVCRREKGKNNNTVLTIPLHNLKSSSSTESIHPAVFCYLSTTEPSPVSRNQLKYAFLNILHLQLSNFILHQFVPQTIRQDADAWIEASLTISGAPKTLSDKISGFVSLGKV